MSDIKNVPGVPGGPGGVDETQQADNQNADRGRRFRKIARRIREERMAEIAAAQQAAQPSATGQANPDAARLKAQIQGMQANAPAAPQVSGLAGLFGNNPAPTPATTQGPSLRDLFGGGQVQAAPVTQTPAAPIFTPTFMTNVANINTATGNAAPLNPMYFATPETAQWLVTQKLPQLGFPGATIIQKNSGSDGGPFVANQQELWIQLPDGTKFNAGFLADYYKRNPEDKFPGLADKYAKDVVNSEIKAQGGKGV